MQLTSRSSIIAVSALVVITFQNCSKVNFSTAQSATAAGVTDTGGPGGGTPTPTCTPSATDTPIITTLPANVTPSMIATICPSVGDDKQCGVVIIVTDAGESLYFTGEGPYDGNDDTIVGVLNMSSKVVNSLALSSTQDIVNFDNDGLDTFKINGTNKLVPGNNMDDSTYGGPNAYYTNLGNQFRSGTVNFITPVATAGGTTYFSLENALTSTNSCLTTSAN